ncbi:flippase [Pontibacter liquoris]|uniref:flippase n=1 Tax=Pontibacter liquoris TaxID=2905677 RepID=UPI0034631BEF
MINKYLSGEKKTVLQSFMSLGAIQATNYLLPLITLPYIIRVIGTDKFGTVAFAQAVLGYFAVVVEYGFGLSATRDISINRENTDRLSKTFSEVIMVKLLLAVSCFLILLLTLLFIPKFSAEAPLFIMGFSLVMGQSIVPVWFFQGMEQMKYLTYLNLGAKSVFAILTFVVIREQSDYIYLILLSSLGNILSGIVGMWIAFTKFRIRFRMPAFSHIIAQLKEGWPIFLSNFSITSYNNVNIIVLGFFTSATIVGYYSIVEKVIWVIRQLLGAFSGAIFPHVCKLTTNSHAEIKAFFKTVFVPFFILIFVGSGILFVFSDLIVLLISGESIPQASFLLKILSVVPVIVVLNNPPYQILVAYNMKKSYSTILVCGALLNGLLNLTLVPAFSAIGTTAAIIFTEVFITLGLYLVLELKHKQYSLFYAS